jgi:hypothetical protein
MELRAVGFQRQDGIDTPGELNKGRGKSAFNAPNASDGAHARLVQRISAIARDDEAFGQTIKQNHATRLANTNVKIGDAAAHPVQPRPRSKARAS